MPTAKKKGQMEVGPDWLPTLKAINALPDPLRKYVRELETQLDPAGILRENAILRAHLKALNAKIAELKRS
ncbi:MAG: hypothetical protein ACREDR_00130 [Blastocatellia bacterium]